MGEWNTQKTGVQVNEALDNGLNLGAVFSNNSANYITCAVTIDNVSVNVKVVWKANPSSGTASIPVYGIAMHPTNGKLYRIKSVGTSTYTAEECLAGNIDLSDYVQYGDGTSAIGDHSHSVTTHTHGNDVSAITSVSVSNHVLSFSTTSVAAAPSSETLTSSSAGGHSHTIPEPTN